MQVCVVSCVHVIHVLFCVWVLPYPTSSLAKSFDLVNVSLAGITHYERHDQPLLQTLLSLGYFSWSAFVLVAVLRPAASPAPFAFAPSLATPAERAVWLVCALLCIYLLLDRSPVAYHAYLSSLPTSSPA